jgi:diapolycopene oxygenase
MSEKQVVVIGAGLGGLSAAISLAQEGYAVTIHEKNPKIGGKLNVLKERGYSFDLGPSILTLPHIFERLFERSGKKMADYFSIRPLRPHWRNFFEDGKVVDLYPEPDRMAEEARKVGEPPENIERFLNYSADLYDLTNEGYFEQGLDRWQDFAPCIRAWHRIFKRAISATSLTSSSSTSAHPPIVRRHS